MPVILLTFLPIILLPALSVVFLALLSVILLAALSIVFLAALYRWLAEPMSAYAANATSKDSHRIKRKIVISATANAGCLVLRA